jgi:transcriptional regulator with GAF, ATPase, and Fis domain
MTLLQQHRWPGNARELRGVVERAVFIATARHLRLSLPALGVAAVRVGETLAAVERDHITATLSACGGQIEGHDGAAARLDLSPRALRATMSRLAIPRPH